MAEVTAKDIWATLSAIDVSGRVEKKGNLSYLSWVWAWGTLMEHYPEAEFRFFKDKWHEQTNTVEVRCEVIIGSVKRRIWLPVMDNRNKAVENPTSREISDARMRCLVKCIALFGLGHHVYAKEDIPRDDLSRHIKPIGPDRAKELEAKIRSSGADMLKLLGMLRLQTVDDLRLMSESSLATVERMLEERNRVQKKGNGKAKAK